MSLPEVLVHTWGAAAWLQLAHHCISNWPKPWDGCNIIWEALFLLFESKFDKPGVTFSFDYPATKFESTLTENQFL